MAGSFDAVFNQHDRGVNSSPLLNTFLLDRKLQPPYVSKSVIMVLCCMAFSRTYGDAVIFLIQRRFYRHTIFTVDYKLLTK